MSGRSTRRLPVSGPAPDQSTVERALLRNAFSVALLTVCSVPTHAGEIVAWGHDYFNQVSGTPTGSDFTAIVAGGWHGYALRADGTIAAWGNDDSSQVSGTPTGIFVAVAAGGFTGYALAADGSITAWGYNGFGGQVTNAPTGTGYTAIAGGYDHAYALAADGSITAWGLDVDGQVSNTPTGTGFTAIAAGEDHGYALRPDGSIAAWGRDLDGQVSGTPTGTGFIAIAAGSEHGLAMAADGSVTAWGDDMWGQVTGAPTTTGFAFLSAGGNQGYLLSATGEITAWGLDAGQVSNAPTASGFTELSGGQHHCYALLGAASFCDATDGALASCPCLNAGAPNTGCDLPQGTGGVGLTLTAQENGPQNRVTWSGTGFPAMGTPASVVIRAATLDPGSPVVFGDGQRCVGTPLVRLAATLASGGAVTHVHGHGVMAGPGTFYYQLWFRSTPIMFCDPVSAFNLSNGRELIW